MRRPVGVVVISGFLFAASAVAVAVGLALLFPGDFLKWLEQFNRRAGDGFRVLGGWGGAMLLITGILTTAIAIGLLRAKEWAWQGAVALFAVNGCGDIVSYFLTGDALRSAAGVVICTVFLYGLARVRPYYQ